MTKRVVIIGGGVVGLCTAWYCVQRGMHVTVIDRNPQPRDGCSFGNAGMLVPSHVIPLAAPGMIHLGLKWMWNPQSPFYIQPRLSWDLLRWLWQFRRSCTARHVQRSAPLLRDLHFRSRELYEALDTELQGGFGLQQRGLLMLCKTHAGLADESATAELAIKFGVPARILDAAETCELDPDVQMDVRGSVYYPQDCHLSPKRLMNSLENALLERGCSFRWKSQATEFITRDSVVSAVRLHDDEIEGDEFVIASGIWSTAVAHPLDLQIPMQAGKGYSVTLDHPVQVPRLCSLLHEARVAVTPIGHSLRVGGTMEMAGVDSSISQTRVEGIVRAIPQYFPAFRVEHFDGIPAWYGLRPCAPDGMPYLGRTSRWRNVVVSTGHAMMGISLAAVSGQLVSEIICGQPSTIKSLALLSPDRFR